MTPSSLNIDQSIVAHLNSLTQQYREDAAAVGAGDSQSGWPEPGEHTVIIRSIEFNPEGKFYVGKDSNNKPILLEAPSVRFKMETLPDTSASDYNPDEDKPIVFKGTDMTFVSATQISANPSLQDDSKGMGWVAKHNRERFKGYAQAILGEEAIKDMDLSSQLLAINSALQGEEAVYARINISARDSEGKDGKSNRYLTDYCSQRLQAPAF